MERNLALIDGFFAAQSALFWLPVFVLYFGGSLAPAEILTLEAVYYAAVVAIEVPSGWLSDRIGRRRTLVLSGLAWAGGAAVIGLSSSFAGFALGQVLLAAGRAFASGTDSSLLFESLAALGRAPEIRARHGRASGIGFITMALSALVGGAVGAIDLRLPYALSVISGLLAAGVAARFTEPPAIDTAATVGEQVRVLRTAADDPVVRRVFAFAVLSVVLIHIPYELQQPWLELLVGVDGAAAWSGVVVGCSFVLAAIGSRIAATRIRLARFPTASAFPRSGSSTAEAPTARGELADRHLQLLASEVGPEHIGEAVLRVGGVPEQEVGDALLTGGADHEIRIW